VSDDRSSQNVEYYGLKRGDAGYPATTLGFITETHGTVKREINA